jgi:hypothetical protein
LLLVAAAKSLAFDHERLAIFEPVTSENLDNTLVIENIRLGFSNIHPIIYFMKSEKLTINHVFNLRNDWAFARAD